MQPSVRTDLAMEAHEASGEIHGVKMEQHRAGNALVTKVTVLTPEGARQLGKPIGQYVTIEQADLHQHTALIDHSLSACIAQEIGNMISPDMLQNVLVVGLGNRDLTPDALGPRTVNEILVSRHIHNTMPELLDARVNTVSAFSPGVMGMTGMETGEVIRAIAQKIDPSLVLVIDSLAARNVQRILSTIQVSDVGVVPGSGVGNHRHALNRQTLGAPVIAIGVPMVIHASTILRDAIESLVQDASESESFSMERTHRFIHDLEETSRKSKIGSLVMTPVLIDEAVRNVATLLAESINCALHPDLNLEEITALRV